MLCGGRTHSSVVAGWIGAGLSLVLDLFRSLGLHRRRYSSPGKMNTAALTPRHTVLIAIDGNYFLRVEGVGVVASHCCRVRRWICTIVFHLARPPRVSFCGWLLERVPAVAMFVIALGDAERARRIRLVTLVNNCSCAASCSSPCLCASFLRGSTRCPSNVLISHDIAEQNNVCALISG